MDKMVGLWDVGLSGPSLRERSGLAGFLEGMWETNDVVWLGTPNAARFAQFRAHRSISSLACSTFPNDTPQRHALHLLDRIMTCMRTTKVIPAAKVKTSKLGTPMEQPQRQHWHNRVRNFLAKHEGPGKKKRRARKSTQDSKVSNQLFLRALDHSLDAIAMPLESFKCTKPLSVISPPLRRYWVAIDRLPSSSAQDQRIVRRSCIKDNSSGAKCLELPLQQRPALFLDMDKGPESWPSTFWLFGDGHVRGAATDDPLHTAWNGCKQAISKAGLTTTKLEIALVLNLFTAPYGGDTFWEFIVEHLEEYCLDCTLEDELFQHFLPALLSRDEMADVDLGSEEQNAKVWEGLLLQRFVVGKPQRLKMSRWFHFISLSADLCSYWQGLLFALVVCAVRSGWDVCVHDLSIHSPTPRLIQPPGPREDAAVEEEADNLDGRAVGIGEAHAEEQSISDPQRGTKKSDQEIEKLRAKSLNTLDAALQVLSRKDCWMRNKVLVVFGTIVNTMHQEDVVMHRTKKGSMEFYRQLCSHGHHTLLTNLINKFHHPGLKDDFKVSLSWSPRPQNQDQDMNYIAKPAWEFVFHLMSYFALVGAQNKHSLPQHLHLLAETTPKRAMDGALKFCKRCFEALEALERSMVDDEELQLFHGNLLWAKQQWCREVLVAIAECNFEAAPDWVQKSALAYSCRWGCTKLSEEAVNVNRDVEGKHRKGHVGRVQRWREAAHSTHMSDHFDVSVPQPQPQHREAATGKKMQPSIFHCRGGDYSLGDATLAQLSDGKWKSPSADNWRRTSLTTQLLLTAHEGGSLKDIHQAWTSLLCSPGLVVKHTSEPNRVYIVLDTTRFGFLGWPVTVVKDENNQKFFYLTTWDEGLKFGFVFDHKEWWACAVDSVYARVNVGPAVNPQWESILVLKPRFEAASLLKVSARMGFPSLTVPFLQRLVLAEGMIQDGCRPPTTLTDLLQLMLEFVLPNLSDAARKAIIETRIQKKELDVENSVLTPELVGELEDQEVVDEKEEIQQVTAALQRRKASSSSSSSQSVLRPAQGALGAPSGASSTSAAEPLVVPPDPASSEGTRTSSSTISFQGSVTPEDAKRFLPPRQGCSITVDSFRHHRWQVKYPTTLPPKSHTETFGPGASQETMSKHLILCYQWAWGHHEAQGQGKCPYTFEVGRDGLVQVVSRN